MRFSKIIATAALAGLLAGGCTTAPEVTSSTPSYADLPVYHDRRTKFVLFSWTSANDVLQFALVREEDRNNFLDHSDSARQHGMDLAVLEEKLAHLPHPSLVTWWYEKGRRLQLPPQALIRHIQRVAAQHRIDLNFCNADDSTA
jgi:hypothetical protein